MTGLIAGGGFVLAVFTIGYITGAAGIRGAVFHPWFARIRQMPLGDPRYYPDAASYMRAWNASIRADLFLRWFARWCAFDTPFVDETEARASVGKQWVQEQWMDATKSRTLHERAAEAYYAVINAKTQ